MNKLDGKLIIYILNSIFLVRTDPHDSTRMQRVLGNLLFD